MNRPIALWNATIYTGEQILEGMAVLVNDGYISDIVPVDDIPAMYEKIDLEGANLCSGLIDIQIYGTGNDLFSAELTSESIIRIEEGLLKQGCTSFYLTLATNSISLFKEAIQVFRNTDTKTALGLHLEGPFLNAKKRGAHPEELIVPIGVDVLEDLLQDSDGVVKIMTVASELCNTDSIDYLNDNNILISAGHSNATFDEAFAAFEAGIPTVTHLWNAMSSLHHRDIGLPGATFNHPKAQASIIVDGIHVDYETVKMSKNLMKERLFLITDAVASCDKEIYRHILKDDHYELPDGTLSGSALSMLQAIENCVKHVDIPLDEAIRMATLYPARLVNLADLGEIKKGFRANITVFDQDYKIKAVFLDGNKVV